jgi:hypothetical protein
MIAAALDKNSRIIAMYHIIHVGMNTEALKQLDDLRRAYPNLYNRADILLQLVNDAHAKLDKSRKPGRAKLHLAA